MNITEREPGDVGRLEALIGGEKNAKQRDYYRIAWPALRGHEKREIAELLGVARSTVEYWAYRYRDLGLDALRPIKRAGPKTRLPEERHEEFKKRITDGPRVQDGVCTLRGKDAVRILNDEFGVKYTLNGVYELLHRLNLSCLTPRPRHEQNDPLAMNEFKKSAPLFSRK